MREHRPSPGRAKPARPDDVRALHRQVGNRALARLLDKGFWVLQPDGTRTWQAGKDTTGFVPAGVPDYKSDDSWFAWPVYKKPVEAAVVVPEPEPAPARATKKKRKRRKNAAPEPEAAVEPDPVVELEPEPVVEPEPEPVVEPEPVAVAPPVVVAAPEPAPRVDYNAIGRSVVSLAIAKFKRDYRFTGPEVRVSDCTGKKLATLDPEDVFRATRRALNGLNPGMEIDGRTNKTKFTAAGGGPMGALGGHKGNNFNIKVKKVDKDGKVRNDVNAEAQVHVVWL